MTNNKYTALATELAYWSQECAARGRNQWAPQEDIQALCRLSGTTWVVTFTDEDGEYELGLSQVSFMGNASARDDQIVNVRPDNS